jgi:hypothetical protein
MIGNGRIEKDDFPAISPPWARLKPGRLAGANGGQKDKKAFSTGRQNGCILASPKLSCFGASARGQHPHSKGSETEK